MPRLPLSLLLIVLLTLAACDSSESEEADANEPARVSDLSVRLVPQGGGAPVTARAQFDEDGRLNSISPIGLRGGVTYDGVVELTDNFADDPAARDITSEVRFADRNYRLFYVGTAEGLTEEGRNTLVAESTDADQDGNPLGLAFTLTTSPNTYGGTLTVVVRHYGDAADLPAAKLGDTAEADAVAGVITTVVAPTFDVIVSGPGGGGGGR
jgi:hypothetical protein